MIPVNEQGVIVIFTQQAETAGFEIVSIQTNFPDATVKRGETTYQVEFEFKASNFAVHRHDIRRCDLIIAWESDWPDCILPVLALSDPDWPNTDLALPSDTERELSYWKQRALTAEERLKRIPHSDYLQTRGRTRAQAAEVLQNEPDMSGAELGRQLGRSGSLGRRLKRELDETNGKEQ